MAFKTIITLCAAALIAQINAQYLGSACGSCGGIPALAASAVNSGCGVSSTGGGFAVSSASPNAPVGVLVVSENVYEGPLSVGGNLPLLGTVGLDGVLPTAGASAVSYGCGDNAVGIASEGPIATGIVSPGTYAPSNVAIGVNGLGIGANGLGLGAIGANGLGLGAIGANGLGLGAIGANGLGLGGYGAYGAGLVGGLNGCGCGALY